MKPIVALQLYTIRDFTSQDLPGALAQVKAMGYDAVELASTYDLEAADYRKLLDNAGLKAVSAHVSIEELKKDTEGTIAKYKTLGCQVVCIPWAELKDLPGGDGFEETKALINKAGAICKQHGMILAYHNHEFEFNTLPCGSFVLDALMDAICPDVLQIQPDLGWVKVAGQDPVTYLKKYVGRCPSVHLKDITKVGDKYEDRPVGQGLLDIPNIAKAAEEVGVSVFIAELDDAVGITSMEAARQSREYLKSLGY